MVDFLMVSERLTKKAGLEIWEIYPKFKIKNPSQDLMIKGKDFYAIWDERKGLWSMSEQDVIEIIDGELDKYAAENKAKFEPRPVRVLHMWDAETGMIDRWHTYCQKQMRDCFHMLDETLIFSNMKVTKNDYASKILPYPLEEGTTEAWDKLIGTLYGEKEKHKIEWCIGAIVTGASKKLQKFMVLYGEPGSGKSTLLDIIDQKLFVGYTDSVDSGALASNTNAFSLESFKNNPLVAIQHEGDLSHIETNTKLNSLVSHDKMTVNEKFKGIYQNAFKSFLILSSNKPVRITDAKSGLLRRLIDVSPTGNKLPRKEYDRLTKQIDFELGAIAAKCEKVYMADTGYYDNYVPINMLGATNDFYNFVMDQWPIFKKQDSTTLKSAWAMYNTYCEDARVSYPYSQRAFKEELKNYFREFQERATVDGVRVRNWYFGFKADKFEEELAIDNQDGEDLGGAAGGRQDILGASGEDGASRGSLQEMRERDGEAREEDANRMGTPDTDAWLRLGSGPSLLDELLSDCPAQYSSSKGTPLIKWMDVRSKLGEIDTLKEHYVKVPEWMIVIDFDIPDENGEKNLEANLKEAAKWPKTYAETSKSGKGIHLHYRYSGDPKTLSSVYADHVEVKVFSGNSSLRRRLSVHNDIPVATISSGLPKKEVKKTVDVKQIQSEKGLRELIARAMLPKEDPKRVNPQGTKPAIDFIEKVLDDAYKSGMSYDVSDMQGAIVRFAASSSHQADYCLKVVARLKYMSDDQVEKYIPKDEQPLVFYDVEVFPNLFLVNYKAIEAYSPRDFEGKPDEQWRQYIDKLKTDHKPVARMINPTAAEIEALIGNRLIGFNCRRYDNHMLYARMMGYSNQQLYMLSQRIINSDRKAFFGEAYNLSYTDVYDFASAGNKMSLKKLEIKMGFFHQELGLEWDKPVDESLWTKVAEYCDNDVLATEAAFQYLEADWTARQILADVAGMTYNDTTNGLTTRIIFDNVRKPQSEFNYRNLAEPVHELAEDVRNFLLDACPTMMAEPHGDDESLLPYFPGYYYGPNPETGKGMVSIYQEEEVGEGGYVYAEPGMYQSVALLDIASMHPHSVIAECLFGPKFTRRFKEIVDGRVDIKHEAWDEVNKILDGKMAPYIEKVKRGEMTSKDLANALKTAINSVYGLTSAAFENAFRDPRNRDNIVAKRGALFMVNLKKEVQARGYTVAHIKTDSIKIPQADLEIIQFVQNYGLKYGYTFEHEATYDRMCLVNNAVYIAMYAHAEDCEKWYGYAPGDNKKKGGKWTATGKQFAVPYVFKTLFTKEDILFEDMCETFQVTGALYLDMNEKLPDVTDKEKHLMDSLKQNGLTWEDWIDIRREWQAALASGDEKAFNQFNSDVIGFAPDLIALQDEVNAGHDYHFIGRVGLFTPVKPGCGGGLLMRESGGKYASATGAKDYRWCESDSIGASRAITGQGKPVFTMDDIDKRYYNKLVDDAKDAISQYGDFEQFVS